jgi:hypothetical protein
MDSTTLTSRTGETRDQLVQLWAKAFNQYGCNSEVTELLSKAAQATTEAVRLMNNPDLKLVPCYLIKGVQHIVHPDSHYALLCGAEIELNATVVPARTVPTCPDCIAQYRAKYREAQVGK